MSISTDSDSLSNCYSERTLAIIKPEAYTNAEEIENSILENGFNILAKRTVKLTAEQSAELYKGHYGHNHFPHLVAHMSSDVIIALVLAGRNAIQRWRQLMGPARSGVVETAQVSSGERPPLLNVKAIKVAEAQAYWPDSLRACYGRRTEYGDYFNGLHGSETEEDALREIHFFFPKMVVGPILRKRQVAAYIQKHLTPTLLPALTKLAHEKPAEPILWLADYLHDNNPNEPNLTVKADEQIDVRCQTPRNSEVSLNK